MGTVTQSLQKEAQKGKISVIEFSLATQRWATY